MAAAIVGHLHIFVLLTLLSVSYSTAVRRIERLRRGLTEGRVANVLDVWTMAGALLLPLPLVVALAVTVYAAEWPTRRIVAGGRPFRYVVSTLVLTLAAVAGSATDHALGGSALAIVAAMVSCALVNDALLAPIIWIAGDRAVIPRLFSLRNHAIDTVAKVFGVLLALATAWHAPAVLLAIPFIYAAHRFALLESIRATAAFDAKTGMWSINGWRVRAAELVADAPSYVVLILVQLYGSVSEAAVPPALASLFGLTALPAPPSRRLRETIRGRHADGTPRVTAAQHALGHYEGQRVALVVEVDLQSAGTLLVRDVRSRLRRAGLACSIGSAVALGCDLDTLLAQAESDLRFEEITANVATPESF
jgi:hypothetical protein